MYLPDVVYGLVRDSEADDTLMDLEAHGVLRTEIEVSDPAPGRYALADEYLHEDARGALRGAVLGASVGFLFGLLAGVAAVSVTSFGLIGWVVMGFGGAGFGALIGGMAGLQANEHPDDDPLRWQDLDDPTGWKLIVVNCKHWRNRAHNILERHGASILDEPAPVRLP